MFGAIIGDIVGSRFEFNSHLVHFCVEIFFAQLMIESIG
jgi:hypothetical protein